MKINWNPSVHQLRTFGLTSLAALPLAVALGLAARCRQSAWQRPQAARWLLSG